MPIFDQGYQHWSGTLSGHAWRWLAITRHGVRVALTNRWLRIALLVVLAAGPRAGGHALPLGAARAEVRR